MRAQRFGLPDLTATQQREARLIAVEARARYGNNTKAAAAIGIAGGTLSTIASGCAACGTSVYKVLMAYKARTLKENDDANLQPLR